MGSVVVSPGVGVSVCGYPVRTGCGHACGGQDLQTHFFINPRAQTVCGTALACARCGTTGTHSTDHTHTHPQTHTHKNTHTQTHTHVYTHTHTHTHTHTVCTSHRTHKRTFQLHTSSSHALICTYHSLTRVLLRTPHTRTFQQPRTNIMHTSAHKRDRNH